MKSHILAICLLSALLLTACFNTENKPEKDDDQHENIIQTDISSNEKNEVDTPTQQDITDISVPESEQETTPVIPPTPSETIDEFFADSAFVGDSVMHGLELYSRRNQCITSPSTFLTVTSFSARHGLSELTEKSYHPSYNGEKMLVEDALSLCGALRVFISIGLNDVLSAPTKYFDQYTEFITRIKAKNPDIKVYVFSPTRPVEVPSAGKMDIPTAAHYKEKICELDTKLREFCVAGYANYVDVASPLLDNNGFLSVNYTSDSYVHLTNKAYTLWTVVLEAYANAEISGLPAPDSLSVAQRYLNPESTMQPATPPSADNNVNESESEITEQAPQTQTAEPVEELQATENENQNSTDDESIPMSPAENISDPEIEENKSVIIETDSVS